MERVFSRDLERKFSASARKRPFTERFNTVHEVIADLEARGLLDDACREYAKRVYGIAVTG